MSQELWEIVQKSNVENVELQLALQCAPLIAGLKVSNLLNIRRDEFPKLQELVRGSHLSWFLLLVHGEKVAILLYRRSSLEAYLAQSRVREQLKEYGYQSFALRDILREFRSRYARYMHRQLRGGCGEGAEGFPHEMGLLLGYPVEDVEGFVKHKGNDFLCEGYWKVYENRDTKLKLFERFESAKESLVRLLSGGVRMEDIIGINS